MARVLLVHQPTDGGVGRHVSDLLVGLTARGHEVFTCGPGPPAPIVDPARHIPLDLQRAVHPRADAAGVADYLRIVRDCRPDVIHAHSSKAGAVVRLARLLRVKIPVVYTPHGYSFAGYFSSELERGAYKQVERLLAPLTTRVVCVCEAEAILARSVGPGDRVRVVYNGISAPPAAADDERMTALASEGPVICALTQLRPGKGIETLIDATPSVLAHHPDARVAIWGEGPDAEALGRRAASHGVTDAVRFLGATTEPLSVLGPSTLFVLPSWAESFPYVILEAMLMGLPTVASDVGGIGEAIRRGQDGLLVPPQDAEALARALVQVLDDDAQRASMGAAARARVEREFTSGRMLDGVEGVYRDVLGHARSA